MTNLTIQHCLKQTAVKPQCNLNRLLPHRVLFLYPFLLTRSQQGVLFTVCIEHQAYSNQAFRSKNNQMNMISNALELRRSVVFCQSLFCHSQAPFQLFTSRSLSPSTNVVKLMPGLRKRKTVVQK